jgi:hypothetical protein
MIQGVRVKFLLAAVLLLAMIGCGGSSSPSSSSNATVSNWQFSLVQEWPRPETALGVSGFLKLTGSGVTGSVNVPPSSQNGKCAGTAAVTGTISQSNVTLSLNEGGTVTNLTGTMSSDGKSMTGSYSGLGGGCFTVPTTGTWTAVQVPPLTGNFTGQITQSFYMALLTGAQPPAPVTVSGSLSQGTNDGAASNATLTGIINAESYPCFRTVSVTGTITGQNVYLTVYSYTGAPIGTIGLPPSTAGGGGAPATVVADASGVSLVGSGPGTSGLALGELSSAQGAFGPCPALNSTAGPVPADSAAITLTLQ